MVYDACQKQKERCATEASLAYAALKVLVIRFCLGTKTERVQRPSRDVMVTSTNIILKLSG